MEKNQMELNVYLGQHGGRRPGSGRKRIHSKGVAHRKRELISSRTPLHINFKYRLFIRTKSFRELFIAASQKSSHHGLSIAYFSIQSNHIHLIAECKDNKALSRGMKSLTNSLAKGAKKGSIQIERYHLHVLRTVKETRHAISYVLLNDLKHGQKEQKGFTGPLSKPRSWLLTSSSGDTASGA